MVQISGLDRGDLLPLPGTLERTSSTIVGDRFHPENARKSGCHGAQHLAKCVGQHIPLDVQGAVLALVVRQ